MERKEAIEIANSLKANNQTLYEDAIELVKIRLYGKQPLVSGLWTWMDGDEEYHTKLNSCREKYGKIEFSVLSCWVETLYNAIYECLHPTPSTKAIDDAIDRLFA